MYKIKKLFILTFSIILIAISLLSFMGCAGDGRLYAHPNEIYDLSIEDWAYGETPSTPHALSTYGEVEFSYSALRNGPYSKEPPKYVGSYWLRAYVPDTSESREVETAIQFRIVKAENVIKTFTIDDIYCYGTPDINVKALAGRVELTYSTSEDGEFGEAPAIFEVGTYYVKATTIGGSCYISHEMVKSFVVNHKPIELINSKYLKEEANDQHGDIYYKSCECCGEKILDQIFEVITD